jgi:mono/diheme cytochrome c family protein
MKAPSIPALVPLLVLSLAAAARPTAGGEPSSSSYSRDVAPIFQRHCQECHRPGEVAPMPLLTYRDARPWAKSIKKHVESRAMPPWHADPNHGKFLNDPSLSDEEVRTIVAWVDAGAPEGDPKDLPAPREWVEGWRIGQPDVVFSMPQEFRVPASGTVPYKYFMVPTHFKEDRWIQAAEARPGNPAVVHHIIAFIREPGKRGEGAGAPWERHLCGTAPGNDPDIFPPGTAKLVKAGSYLVLQMHYTPNGEETTDRSSIGLVFAREPPQHRMRVQAAMNPLLRIPPGASDHVVKSVFNFGQDSVLWGLMPHMHLRGKSFRFDIVFPDGRTDTLLNVPRYDFNWQHGYALAQPLEVPAGSRVECTAVFDNSKENRANPDPTQEVRWGDQTWEEMMIGFLSITHKEEELPEAKVEGEGPAEVRRF